MTEQFWIMVEHYSKMTKFIVGITTHIYNMSHQAIEPNNQVRNLIRSCNWNVLNDSKISVAMIVSGFKLTTITILEFHNCNSWLQYLDFTITILTNQYLQLPSRLQSTPHDNDHNSSPRYTSQRWVGQEHGGPSDTHKDRGHNATEREPHHDHDHGSPPKINEEEED
jgi:hypothetical protein